MIFQQAKKELFIEMITIATRKTEKLHQMKLIENELIQATVYSALYSTFSVCICI